MSTVEVAVAGVRAEGRQATLADLHHEQEAGRQLAGRLARDPANRHDPNAIGVVVRAGPGLPFGVGFVPRILAAKLAPRMDAGEQFPVQAVRIIAGEQNGKTTFGVRLDVENV